MAVEPTSLTLLACQKTGDRSAAAWQKVLEPFTNLKMVFSDAAQGIASAVHTLRSARAASGSVLEHGLDVFHTFQEARRVLAGCWRRAEAAWNKAETAEQRVTEAKQQGRDARNPAQIAWRAWHKAETLLSEVEQAESAWERMRAAFVVFRPDGKLNDRMQAEAEIQAVLAELRDSRWKKTCNFLRDERSYAFLDELHRRLHEAEPDALLRQLLVRRWWLRHQAPPPSMPPPSAQSQVQALLEAKLREGKLTADEQATYDRVAEVLRTTVRASSAVEGINSVLRMQQGRHRKMTPGLLALKRLYWNTRRLQTGPRRGRCPYELLGVSLPSLDFWTLLRDLKQDAGQHRPKDCQG